MTDPGDSVPNRAGVFYGWWIVLLAMLTLFVTNGITLTGITVFDRAILGEFGWERGALKLRDLITLGLSGLMAPFIGALADRYSVKRLMIAGCLLLAGALGGYSQLRSLTGLYAIHVAIGLVLALAGLVLNVVIVSRWFIVKRGTALGLTIIGTSLGGTLFPIIGARLLTLYDWRTAMGAEALFALGMAALLALFLKDRPEEMGLQPLGAGSLSRERTHAAIVGMEYADAIRTRTFWILAFCAMTTFYCILGVQANLVLHLQDLGWTLPDAAKGVGVMFTMGMISKFAVGYLADSLDRRLVLIANISVMLAGALCLASMRPSLIWPFILIFGLGWGGLYTLLQLLCMDSFGVRSGGKILGTITVLDALGGGLGPFVTGKLFDLTRSYQTSFALVAGLVGLALVASFFLHPPKPAVVR
jgi:MFS family permease